MATPYYTFKDRATMMRLGKVLLAAVGVIAFLLVVLLLYLWWASTFPPDPRPTKPDSTKTSDDDQLPSGPLGVFKQKWNSQERAEWSVAKELSEISDNAYLDPAPADTAFKKRGFLKVTPITKGSMMCYVVSGHDVTVVAFRGTDFLEFEDWAVNGKFLVAPQKHGNAHRGFANSYRDIGNQILALVRDSKPKYLWITGHSLGGALALMCAFDCTAEQGIELAGLMTFGQPRVGDKAFCDYVDDKLKGKYAYFVNQNDVVPRLPQWLLHSGSLVWFKDDERVRTNAFMMFGANADDVQEKKIDELPPLSDAELEAVRKQMRESRMPRRNERDEQMVGGGLPLFIKDHLMQYYIEKIAKMLKKPVTPSPTVETPISWNVSIELGSRESTREVKLKRGETLEIKFSDPPLPNMMKDVAVKVPSGIQYLGNRYNTVKSPDGRLMVGAGYRCIYVKADSSGQVVLTYIKGTFAYEHKIDVIVTP